MRGIICLSLLAVFLAFGSPVAGQESESPSSNEPVEVKYPSFGVGVCIARGAGLMGIYTYFRPVDAFALEIDLGLRILVFSGSSETEVFWPLMGSLKGQFYLNKRSARFQSGIELGVIAAQDMGVGGELSYIMHFRLAKSLYLDGTLGAGYCPNNTLENTASYLAKVGEHSKYYYENSVVTIGGPFMIIWGVGISFMF